MLLRFARVQSASLQTPRRTRIAVEPQRALPTRVHGEHAFSPALRRMDSPDAALVAALATPLAAARSLSEEEYRRALAAQEDLDASLHDFVQRSAAHMTLEEIASEPLQVRREPTDL